MERHLIAFEGPIGVSKTDIVRRVAEQLDATTVLDEAAQNPFLPSFYEGRPGAALQTELFFLLSRYRQQQELIQRRLFSGPTLVDYVFERSKLFAYLNLDDNELLIFDKLFSLLAESVPRPDLVVYLQSPLDSLIRRVRERGRAEETHLSEEYVAEVNQAYNYYFFHYTQTPLLVVNIADVDLVGRSEDLEDLVKQIRQMGKGTRYYVPLGSKR
jgi:deoxyguanosine kinase